MKMEIPLKKIIIAVVALAASLALSGVANADASGTTTFNSPVGIHSGTVKGSGNTINQWSGVWNSASGTVCNWRFRYQQFDRFGVLKGTDSTSTRYSCDWGGFMNLKTLGGWGGAGWNFGPGKACVSLMSNNSAKATVCFSIHP